MKHTAQAKAKPVSKAARVQSMVALHIGNGKQEDRPATANIIVMVRNGLPFKELETLRAALDLPMEEVARKLDISRATLHRRKNSGRLETDESDKVVRYARLVGKAVEVFGDIQNARKWLSFPQYGLGDAIPLDYAQTEIGAREVENLLGRIEYGVNA